MKKSLFFLLFFALIAVNKASAEAYHFKGCKISNAVIADYTINIKKKLLM